LGIDDSESKFESLGYSSGFPDRFGSLQNAAAFCRSLFTWYNTEDRLGGIGMTTPEDVHYELAKDVPEHRKHGLLEAAFENYSEPFHIGMPLFPAPPDAA